MGMLDEVRHCAAVQRAGIATTSIQVTAGHVLASCQSVLCGDGGTGVGEGSGREGFGGDAGGGAPEV